MHCGDCPLTEMVFIPARVFFFLVQFTTKFSRVFFLLPLMVLKKKPQPWDGLFVSALDGRCYIGEEVWGEPVV